MAVTPIGYAESLRIGIVDFVSPNEIKVLLDLETPSAVALNTGVPSSFPRVNSYVLIPSDDGYLVGQVEWITVERVPYPKRTGAGDSGLIDLPNPLRKMSLNPLGYLVDEGTTSDDGTPYKFRRGVGHYPTVGDPVLLPTQQQVRAIIESGENRYVRIGVSPLAGNAEVRIDPDRLFGRHLAVLGNTGSGKSCTVAGLIRWSLQAASQENGGAPPNARFIVLDPNGEYAKAFEDLTQVRVFAVEPREPFGQLQVPLWFWNSEEWNAFAQAGERAQRPLLRRALREIRSGGDAPEEEVFTLRRKISSMLVSLKSLRRAGAVYQGWRVGPLLAAIEKDLGVYIGQHGDYAERLAHLKSEVTQVLGEPGRARQQDDGSTFYNNFPATEVENIVSNLESFLSDIGGAVYQAGPNEDVPLPFGGAEFAGHLESLAQQESNPQYFDYLVMRIRMMLGDTRIRQVSDVGTAITLAEWLKSYIGDNRASNGTVTVIDLSLVPAEIIHVATAVIVRMTLEALQRYRKLNAGRLLPTVLVMEEAHTFIRRYQDAENQSATAICSRVFEKISREGRKFGLGLVLSSQRPSELSPTVLSQCNSFILHRISNDNDQDLVRRLVPDNLRGLLRELPSLPSREAILLGWASELPVLVQIDYLAKERRPESDDPDFWAVWTGAKRDVDWQVIADEWQQSPALDEEAHSDIDSLLS